jgi:hypothetical protein
VDVIVRQYATDNINAILDANLAANITNPQLNVASQNFVVILRRPDEVVTMVANAMFTRRILHAGHCDNLC